MKTLFASISENVQFVLLCLAVTAAVVLLAWGGERLVMKKRHRLNTAHTITTVGMLAAISGVLMVIELPLFFAPPFYKLDFSELPVLICAFSLGPVAGVVCEFLKVLIHLLLKGTSTAFVGDLANFLVGCSFVLPASILYQKLLSKKGAVASLALGTGVMTVFGSLFNAWFLIPRFAVMYGLPLDAIIAMGTQVNGAITDLSTLVLLAVVPFNLLKGVLVSVLTFFLYKRVERLFFRKKTAELACVNRTKGSPLRKGEPLALQSSKKDLTNIRNRTILRWSDFGQLGGTDMNRVFDQALMAYNKETKKLDDLYRSAAKNCGMAECAFWILYTLRVEEKSFTQAEICEFLVEPKQTVNSALKKLVAEGYLALSAGTDQRSKLVRLTPKGEQLARERVDRIPEAEAAALRAMSPDDRAAFLRLTRQYRLLFEQQLRTLSSQGGTPPDPAAQQ